MKVLITGAGGFIGRRLAAALLHRGDSVIAIGRHRSPRIRGWIYHQGDLVRSQVLQSIDDRPQAVVHLAAQAHGCRGLNCVSDNVFGLMRVAEWALEREVRRVVFSSSTAIYRKPAKDGAVGEASDIRPDSLYGWTKNFGEQFLKESRVPHLSLRLPHVYGPGCSSSLMTKALRSVLEGRTVDIPDDRRDWLHVDDAVQAMIAALRYRGTRTVFDLGSGKLTSMTDLVAWASELLGRPIDCRLGRGTRYSAYPSKSARQELVWRPRVGIRDGVRQLVRHLQAESPRLAQENESRSG